MSNSSHTVSAPLNPYLNKGVVYKEVRQLTHSGRPTEHLTLIKQLYIKRSSSSHTVSTDAPTRRPIYPPTSPEMSINMSSSIYIT